MPLGSHGARLAFSLRQAGRQGAALGKQDVKGQQLISGNVVVFTVINTLLVDLVVDHEPPLDKVILYGALALGVLINGSLLTVAQVVMQRRRSRLAKGMPDDAGKVLGWSWALALFSVVAVAVLL